MEGGRVRLDIGEEFFTEVGRPWHSWRCPRLDGVWSSLECWNVAGATKKKNNFAPNSVFSAVQCWDDSPDGFCELSPRGTGKEGAVAPLGLFFFLLSNVPNGLYKLFGTATCSDAQKIFFFPSKAFTRILGVDQ